jgi:hypothetical protein
MYQTVSTVEEVEKLEPLCTAGGNIKWCSHFGKLAVPQTIKHGVITTQQLPFFGIHSREVKHVSTKNLTR